MNWEAIIWLCLMVVFLVVEGVCAFHLVSIWFTVGALVAMIASLLGAEISLQITLFLAVSCLLLALLWPFVKKVLKPRLTKTNIDSVIGSTGLVTVAIDNVSAKGQVKLGTMEWTARSASGQPIPQGVLIRVDRIEGVKVIVTPVNVEVSV